MEAQEQTRSQMGHIKENPQESESQSALPQREAAHTEPAPSVESESAATDIRQDAVAQRRLRPRVRETVGLQRSGTQSVIARSRGRGTRTDAAPPEESGTVSADIRQDAGAQRRLRPSRRRGTRTDVAPPEESGTVSADIRQDAGAQGQLRPSRRRGTRTDVAPPEESGTVSADIRQDAGAQRQLRPSRRRGTRTDVAPPEESGTVSADIRQDVGAQRRLRPRVRVTVGPQSSVIQDSRIGSGRRETRTGAAPSEERDTALGGERQRSRRERESSGERAVRQQAEAERQRRRRERESSDERAVRQQTQAERQRKRREIESSEERAIRQQADVERQRGRRERESSEERAVRQQADVERQRGRRERESSEERAVRQQADVERQRGRRERESSEERRPRLRSDTERHRRARAEETSQERSVRLTSDVERHRRTRNRPSVLRGIALRSRFTDPGYLDCCELGRFNLNFFNDFPGGLRRLFVQQPNDSEEHQRIRRNFMENIRTFNSALAMASMGAQVDALRGRGPYCYRIHGQVCHRIGPLHPQEGEQRQYGQIYILDTEMAAQERLGNIRNVDCDPTLMRFLSELISNVN
ncbi:unnamed protein product, partial [Haemonchus placei]|uniref:Trichohyalin-like n=1 Tax=Haemonchus placei TaxID=6290 RepID=A0A0N4VUL6_HAEPC